VTVGEWRLDELIGEGAMGKVWRGVHRGTGEPAAVKVLPMGASDSDAFFRAFRNEVEAVARLNHRGVVHIFDFGEMSREDAKGAPAEIRAGDPYLVMELAGGGKLNRRDAPRPWPELKRILCELLDALAHAHARGIIHRDVKPGNVLFDAGGVLKLTDFGLAHARRVDPREHTDDVLASCGTPPYMAPEQFQGDWRAQGPWTDLYAVGCLSYALATGAPPFLASDLHDLASEHLFAPPPELRSLVPLPRAFGAWVHTLLAKQPEARFGCAADARHALAGLDERDVVAAEPREPSAPPAMTDTATLVMAAVPAAVERSEAAVARPTMTPGQVPDWRGEAAATGALRARSGLALFGLREAPLVGREAERDAVWEQLRDVHRYARPRAVLLRGAAGAGKSRLARWLAQRADELGCAVVMSAAHCAEGGSHDGLLPMLLRHLRGQHLERPELAARLDAALEQLGNRDYDLRAGLLDLFAPASSGSELVDSKRGLPGERESLLYELLRLCARERPLLLVIDDAQWGLDALRLVRRIQAERGAPLAALSILTVRDGELARRYRERGELDAMVAEGSVTTLDLAPLAPADQRELVGHLLGLRADLVERLVARTGGNPLFAVQLIGDWIARGVLRADADGFGLRAGAEDALPEDLRALCQARVAQALAGRRLDDALGIELSALLGAEFDEEEWTAACAAAGLQPSAALLPELARQGLLERGLGAWRFAHGVIREVIEHGVGADGRAAHHHRAIAQVLKVRQRRGGGAELAIRVARHFRAAGDLHAAHPPLLAAARALRIEGDLDRAVGLVADRTALLDELCVPAVEPLRAEGDLLLAQLLLGRAERDAARELASRVAATAASAGWPALEARALLRLADAAASEDDFVSARRLHERALAALTAFGDARGVFEARQGLAEADYFLGEMDRCAAAYLENRALAEQLGDEHAVAETLWGLGYVALGRGELREARELFEGMRERLAGRNATHRMSECYCALGEVARRARRYQEAEQWYWAAVKLGAAFTTGASVICRANVAMSLFARGELATALEVAEEASSEARERNYVRALAAADSVIAAVHARRGDWPAAAAKLDSIAAAAAAGICDEDDADHLELIAMDAATSGQDTLAARAGKLAAAFRPRVAPARTSP
jgi:tetratricopeptide (TPR) repeat protein